MYDFILEFYQRVLPESPRWLLSKNRQEEAREILEGVARTNKRELKAETWDSLLNTLNVKFDYLI